MTRTTWKEAAPVEGGPPCVVSRGANSREGSLSQEFTSGGAGGGAAVEAGDLPNQRRAASAGHGSEPSITLAKIASGNDEVRVALGRFRGALEVDIRIFQPFTTAKAMMPTKRGVSVGVEHLRPLIAALQTALAATAEGGR